MIYKKPDKVGQTYQYHTGTEFGKQRKAHCHILSMHGTKNQLYVMKL